MVNCVIAVLYADSSAPANSLFALLQVLAFFAKLGLPLREKPPMMLVDGPTLQDQKQDEDDGMNGTDTRSEEPVFHTRGLCMSKVWGRMSHVAGTQRGYSQLHKQPSLDATLRPADLSARRVEVMTIPVIEMRASLGTCIHGDLFPHRLIQDHGNDGRGLDADARLECCRSVA